MYSVCAVVWGMSSPLPGNVEWCRKCGVSRRAAFSLLCADAVGLGDVRSKIRGMTFEVLTYATNSQTLVSKTGSSICRSEMKSFAAILIGPIQYIEISQGTAFFLDEGWNVINAQGDTQLSCSKESSHYDFSGSHIGRPNANPSYWL